MNQSKTNLNKLKKEYKNFFLKFRSLELSSINENNHPQASYAPFVLDNRNNIFIFVSTLANHTKNLISSGKAGVILIESEEESENIFARKRIIFDCKVSRVSNKSEEWDTIMSKFEVTFGQIMQILKILPDFKLLKLMPVSGRFILGFGNAYEISGETMDELLHLKPKNK